MKQAVLSLLAMAFSLSLTAATLSVSGNRFLLDGTPFDMWGVRTASATQTEELTRQLIANLDEYRKYGVNTVSVYYMGSRAGFRDPFSADGASIDPAHQKRMSRIIEECDRRAMVVVVGIFYQRSNPPRLRDWESAKQAVRTVARSLRPFRNIIINIANEQNSNNYKNLPWSRVMNPNDTLELCRIVKQADPQRLVGAGGYDHVNNDTIGKDPGVDVLLFDTSGPEDSGALYRRFTAAGIDKPIVNVETFGGWTIGFRPQGVFPEHVRKEYLREIGAAARHTGLYLHLHNSPWFQALPPDSIRYDLGGDGTASSPGVRWYFEALSRARKQTAPTK
jgi:hypothetical protein